MNKQRLEQLFSGLLVLSFFLPWFDRGLFTISAMKYPGFVSGVPQIAGEGGGQAAFFYVLYLIPVLAAAVILFSFQGKNTKMLSLLLGALSILLSGYFIIDLGFAFGTFIAILAGLGIVVTELRGHYASRRKKEKSISSHSMIKKLPVLIFLVFFAFLAKSLFHNRTEIPSPLIGKPIPTFSLPRLNAEGLVSDNDIVGKISLINVWATWCVGCLEEHQLLIKLSQGPMAIPIIGINWKDQTDSAIRWLEERGNPYTEIAVDYEGKTAIDFGVYGAPETFLIDDDGIIHYKHIGALTVDVWAQEFLPIINKLKQ